MSLSVLPRPLSISPEDSRLSAARWFYVWGIGLQGECLCPRGATHLEEQGAAYSRFHDCSSAPGKHPWHVWNNGEPFGFKHGVSDAVPYGDLQDLYGPPGGSKRLAMSLQDVVLLDIDSVEAMQSFYRIRRHVPSNKMLGLAKTPRGWHIYLTVPGWSQKAISVYMRNWLGSNLWHPTDPRKISRRGMVLDVRTGPNRYTVWPETRDRHWASAVEFRSALEFAGNGMPRSRMVEDGSLAPWNLELTPDLQGSIARAGEDSTPQVRASGGLAETWNELERWCAKLEQMEPESGRNNTLNHVAYFQGADAIAAGHSEQLVRSRLVNAAAASGTPGASATITSGLTSGLRARHAGR